MGGGTSKPVVSKKETEDLTMHPRWETHVNEEKNLGFFFSLINVHISCALGTILIALCCMIWVFLCYLGYRQFCHPKKTKQATMAPPPPPMCATCSSCSLPSSTSLRPWDKEAMEDRYYASMRHQDDDDFGFTPQRYERYEQLRRYKQRRYEQPRQLHYNRGRIVDPVEQLCQFLQASPMTIALASPALAPTAPPALAQVHQVQLPAAQPLNLGANNAPPWFSSKDPILKLLYKFFHDKQCQKFAKVKSNFSQ
jgi:hypothetical protein